MIKLYGFPGSTCTRRVLMTLAETGLSYELVAVDLSKGEHKREPHVSRQPFGRIPAIEDEGFTLYESRAIVRYLNDRASASFAPSDLRVRAKMEQWISVEASEFSPHAMKFVAQHVFKRPQTEAVIEAAAAALEISCAVLDRQLAATPYLTGAGFSLADLCFMPEFEYAMTTPASEIVRKNAHLAAWWRKVSERPAWLKVTGKL